MLITTKLINSAAAACHVHTLQWEALVARGNAPTVLVNDEGQPWGPDKLSYRLRETCEQAKLESLGLTSYAIPLAPAW
jgi:hypothetical protein